VCQAYQELWALGYVDSRPGAYTRVRARAPLVAGDERPRRSAIDWDSALAPAASAAWQRLQTFAPEADGDDTAVSLSHLELDPRLYPLQVFRRCLDRALRNEGTELLRYGDRQGHPGLRRQIAERARTHGMTVEPEQVLLTNGSQNAIDLVLRLLAGPGSRVAVEEPTYANFIPLLACHQVEPLGVPMTDDGLDLKAMERLLEHERPALLYTIPNFHNPTGITTSQTHREALLELCRRHRLPEVEDGFEDEMKYFGRVTLPIKSMDREQVVVYLGTFSKVLFPGVRVGWIIADAECIERLVAIRRFADLSSSAVLQAGLAEMLSEGHYEAHIRKMHRVFRRRMAATLQACREHRAGRGLLDLGAVPRRGSGRAPLSTAVRQARRGRVARGLLLRLPPAACLLPHLHLHARRARGLRRNRTPWTRAARARRRRHRVTLPPKEGITYGPVRSRRLGRSLGINLMPPRRKVCTFDCVYCQYGPTASYSVDSAEPGLPTVPDVVTAVEQTLSRLPEPPQWLTFSGNGEPTLHPELPAMVGAVCALRDRLCPATGTAVLSCSSEVYRPEVRKALARLDQRIMKLDVGTSTGLAAYNRPAPGIELEGILAGLRELPDITIQALLTGGSAGNSEPGERAAWIDRVVSLSPATVQIYTLARPTSCGAIEAVPAPELDVPASELRLRGVNARVF